MNAFNLRGTNGSGKTYVATALLARSNARPFEHTTKKSGKIKPLIYRGELFNLPFYIFGSYETYCGGCDTIPSVHIVAELLDRHLRNPSNPGLVFYEGLMISHMLGTVGNIAHLYNSRHVMAFLDTPIEVCIERVRSRRAERGNIKPFDPNRTLVGDYKAVKQAKQNALRAGFAVVDIDHTLAVDEVLRHLKLIASAQCATLLLKPPIG
jgi:hypothetical protein